MTIAVICDVLGKENNGTTIAAMNLIRSLREKGYDVRVVCSDPERAGQKDFYVVPILNLGPLNAYVAKNGVALANPDRNILTVALNGVDHVHVMMPFALGSAAARLAHKLGLPLTAHRAYLYEGFSPRQSDRLSRVLSESLSLLRLYPLPVPIYLRHL